MYRGNPMTITVVVFDLYGTLADVVIDEVSRDRWQLLASQLRRSGVAVDEAGLELRKQFEELCATAAAFTAFALNVYLVTLAPHWGQRETLLTYYATRAGEQEPLVAFQMNWKGENFYTGNQMATFVRTGAPFKRWLAEQRGAGTRVIYVTTEHGRLSTLKAELGKVKSLSVLTKPELNNKFFLARVEL